jgi:hypothetical protein
MTFVLTQGVGTFLPSQGTMFKNMVFARIMGLTVLFVIHVMETNLFCAKYYEDDCMFHAKYCGDGCMFCAKYYGYGCIFFC